jgi:pilus assembly protein CpaB
MNSTFLRILVVILAIGAITTAWIGYRISTKPPADAVKIVTPTYTQVVASKEIPQGKLLTIDDVEVITTTELNPNAYPNTHDVVGKMTQMPIAAGEAILSKHLPSLGALAESLAPNERAVAVKVNEVIGVGGFIKPGDRVDVLLFLRAERETDNVSSAQVVLRDIKVLAYGDILADDAPSQTDPDSNTNNPVSTNSKKSEAKKEKDSRSAILAVPEQQVSRLMLAESSGTLRLALRGIQPLDALADQSNQFVRLEEVARPVAVSQLGGVPETAASAKTTPTSARKATAVKRDRVIIHKGEHTEVVTVNR